MNYCGIWKNFNQFYLKLDVKPDNWEDRLTLYIGYLISKNRKSTTIKSYISAIKAILLEVDVELSENCILLASLMKACKLINDQVQAKLPITKGFLNMLIDKVDVVFRGNPQPYLIALHKAILSTAYFGLFWIGEITQSSCGKSKGCHIGLNKKKLMFVLHTSKTHGLGAKPQIMKITSINRSTNKTKARDKNCPFTLLQNYLKLQKKYLTCEEQFFVFRDRSPVQSTHFRKMLSKLIAFCNLNPRCYSSHSLRSG